ncbi:MAG: HAD-IIIA family hydrolase [Bacteroidales bacterium]|nr:HAD-IIIA family hydrolase [Bacteroidales bacterium]
MPVLHFDHSWTLFLDRDGVINRRFPGGYVTRWESFEFLPGVLDAIAGLAGLFRHIVVVTNQQGVGKGVMTHAEMERIHYLMCHEIESRGGRIDRVYFAPQLDSEGSPFRKPGPGMALKAREDFPDIDFSKSVMVGDTAIDILFGKQLGMFTVLIADQVKGYKGEQLPDMAFGSLLEFQKHLIVDAGQNPQSDHPPHPDP